ncbi:hypothetical protein BVX97_05400 [bacterium E08(2017)]|nr:hypothetical protein BVX97_05400 [bacterium E08(2017)]
MSSSLMNAPSSLAIIAGKGAYPRLLAESARSQGVSNISVIAFKRETDPRIEEKADSTTWIHIGQLEKMLEAIAASDAKQAVMAGQVTPTSLFNVRLDAKMRSVLKELSVKNAETIFGAVGNELKNVGVELIPASTFMEDHMPQQGVLTARSPEPHELSDIELGKHVAKTTSGLDIGQTVVIKEGTILAVEAFEGTNAAIRRAADLAGEGIVIVKVAKNGHDMRFDIPVVGPDTIRLLKKIKAGVLAIEAGRAIILDRNIVIEEANNAGICVTAVSCDE